LAARHEAARRAAVVAQAENSAAGQAATALLMQQELEAAHNLAKVGLDWGGQQVWVEAVVLVIQ
jgi:hypothetical protein